MVGVAVTVMVVLLVGRDKRLVEQADKGHRSGREEQEQDHHKEDGKATLAHLVRLGCFQFILLFVIVIAIVIMADGQSRFAHSGVCARRTGVASALMKAISVSLS
jgi:hypothetical protein